MCGIAGAVDHDDRRAAALVRRLNELQAHRGPDNQVIVRTAVATLGNTRLAVQEPGPVGNQPFTSADGRYICVFNGEIYNHRDLVQRYSLPVRGRCDGEVVPLLWEKLGAAALGEFRGMFSIALMDCLEERLYLARDRFGIKPLHLYAIPGGPLLFASEVRSLIRVSAGLRLDAAAVARYLTLGSMAADQSPFTEIVTVPPGSVAVTGADLRVQFQPLARPDSSASSAPRGGLASALTDSIDLHLSADVPAALLLSGGVDSATIASVSRRLGRDLHCITVAAAETADESAEARHTATHYGHRFQRISAALASEDVASFFDAMQRPTIDGLNTYLVCRAVREAGFKVALSGLGGDEALGGYSHFRLLRYLWLLDAVGRLPKAGTAPAAWLLGRSGLIREVKARALLARSGPRDGWGLSLLQREVLPRTLAADLTGVASSALAKQLRPHAVQSSASFGALVDAEVAIYLQSTLLPDADAFSMASSVELRVPFVDDQVFAAALASVGDRGAAPGKASVGRALNDPYLRILAGRPKRGFSVPMREWMNGPLAGVLAEAQSPDAAVWSILDRAAAQRAGLLPLRSRDRWSEIWVLAALNAWLQSIQGGMRG